MGRIARVLSFLHLTRNGVKVSDVKVDPGSGENITAEHFSAPGDDSQPLPGDFGNIDPAPGTGRGSITGYIDPKNQQKSRAGEKRIYARDSTGAVVVEVWLKNDGTATINNAHGSAVLAPDGSSTLTTPAATFNCNASGSIKGNNAAGSFELQPGGNVVINGVTIDTSGNINSPATIVAATSISAPAIAGGGVSATTSLTVAGKEMSGHQHPQGPDSAGNTQQNTGGPL